MLINFLSRHEADTEADPQGGSSGKPEKARASDLRSQLGNTVDEQALMRILEKQSDLLNDNHQLRTKNATLRTERDDARGKVVPEGARVLNKDEAALWDAYSALGAPDAIKQGLDAAQTASTELTALKRG